MKTAMQETSLDAYWELVKKLPDKETDVLSIIMNLGACSNKTIARELRWDINRVTGRTNSLVKKGLVRADGKRLENGFKAIQWTLNK